MSANNYRICPRCLANVKAEREKLSEFAQSQYGKVSPDEYNQLIKKAADVKQPTETLREDWELATRQDGEFFAYYGCSCDVCGFSHEFKHKQQLEI